MSAERWDIGREGGREEGMEGEREGRWEEGGGEKGSHWCSCNNMQPFMSSPFFSSASYL